MSKPRFQLVTAVACAAILLLSACGQAGPLYLPDQGTRKNKSLRREQRAKANGNTAMAPGGPNSSPNNGVAPDDKSAAPASPAAAPAPVSAAPTPAPAPASNQPPTQP